MPVRELMRHKEKLYAELALDNPALSDDALIDAMLAHPILINRPIVVTPLGTRLCRPSEAVLDILPLPQRAAFAKEGRKAVGQGADDLDPLPLAIGVGFELARVESIHPEAHDMRLDAIVTETGVQQTRQGRRDL